MRTFYGKQVLDTLGEMVDPKHTAVLVVDLHEAGHDDVSCLCAERDLSMVQDVLPRLVGFLEEARGAGTAIAWVQNTTMVAGAEGSSLALGLPAGMTARPGEIVVRKTRPNGFMGTGLDVLLRRMGVQTTIVTGITTEGCVSATALGASHLDFYSVVLEDCIASFNRELHESALAVLRYRCDSVSLSQVLAQWAQT